MYRFIFGVFAIVVVYFCFFLVAMYTFDNEEKPSFIYAAGLTIVFLYGAMKSALKEKK